MTQAYRAAGTASVGNLTSGTTTAPGAPAGLATDDVMVAVLTAALPGSSNTQPTVATPSGWTLLASGSNQSTSAGDGMWIYGRVATGSDTMPTWTFGTAGTKFTAVVYAWSGVPGNALPTASVTLTGSGTSSTTAVVSTGTNTTAAWAASVASGRSSTNTTMTVAGGTNNTRRQPSGITANTVANAGGGGSTDQLLSDSNGDVTGTIGGETFTAGTTSTWQVTGLIKFPTSVTNATVTAVAATGTAAAGVPTVSTSRTAVAATATAGALAPAVSSTAVVGAVAATATAGAVAPSVSGTASVTAVAATGTAAAPAPTVTTNNGITIVAVPATADASALAPAIDTSSPVTVTAVTATGTATALAPSVTTTNNALVVAPAVTGFAAAHAPVINGDYVPPLPLIARLNIDRVIINLADDLAQYVAAGSAGALGGGSSRADTFTQQGEFRTYAGGNTRLIQGTATSRVLDPLVLRACTPDQVAKLKAWTGKTVQFRDSYGRRLFGAYLQPVVSDIPLSGTAGSTLLSDVQIVLIETVS